MKSGERSAKLERRTSETNISIAINIDGKGRASISTGIPFLDHMLRTLVFYAGFDAEISASGDLRHHIIEDVAITFGETVNSALGERQNIRRFGYSLVPMDDSLALAAVDMVKRPYSVISIPNGDIDGVPVSLIAHFIRSFSTSTMATLHIKVLYGDDPHHSVEAAFKALGLAMKEALSSEERAVNSTKGKI